MKLQKSLLLLGILIQLVSCQHNSGNVATESPKDSRPNILFILADDHTVNAISAYGGMLAEYAQTSNIDQLASEGMRFDNVFCTNSICSPSRATILSGKYSHENGVYCLNQPFDTTQVTSSKVLQAAGYQTAVFGKWHLGTQPAGFDEYKVLKKQGRYIDPQFVENGKDSLVTYKGWSTDVITKMTQDFITNRKADKPFFVMCQFKTTHDPWATRPPFDTLFQHIDLPEPENLFDDHKTMSEAAQRTTLVLEKINQGTFPHTRLEGATEMEQRRHIYQQYIKAFLQCGRILDENVGQLMAFLKENGLDENTIVVYTADQGHFLGEHGFFSKRFMYDESLRMPLIIRYPKMVQKGTVNKDIVINPDFAPTLIDLGKGEIPTEMQGKSIVPLLKRETPEDWRKSMYYHYWQHLLHRNVTAHYGIRTKDYKLIYYYGQSLGQTDFDPVTPEWELFDLGKDPQENNNVYGDPAYEDIVKTLKTEMLDLKDKYSDKDDKYPELLEVNEKYFWRYDG